MDKLTKDKIQKLIDSNPVMVFMKGTKLMPQCGFSNNVVQILNSLGVEFGTFDVLSDFAVREGIKEYSDWPTIPQVYLKGEFLGGSDILIEMYNSGSLKEKIEIASSICKVDLMSDLVGEFPELQGVMGGYFAREQGFDEEISLAVSEHYLPSGIDSKVPKKPYSIALSLSDKIDSLVGFFGINLKPTSSKDPYALRRMAISLLRLIIENQKKIKLRDLINYSINLYKDQNYSFDSKLINDELGDFILERLKNYLKEKNIRSDIIECSTNSYGIDDLLKIFNKSLNLNKNIKKDFGLDVIAIYKRSANILNSESKSKLEIVGSADPGLFKNDYEKNLYKKIHTIRKYFSSIGRDEDYDESLKTLSSAKTEVNEFFDNVIVNDQEEIIKKNRLELLKMLCKSFDNYFNFSKIEA